jgi:beta-aspartyl-peptidase (threonine type)
MPRPALLLSLLLALACHQAPASPAPALDDRGAVLLEAMRGSAAAWNRGDIAGHVALYTDSAQMMMKAGPKGGREVIRAMLERGFWKDGKPEQQLGFSDLVVTALGRDYAMMTGGFRLAGGGKPDATGRFTLLWQRTPQGWRIIHDHSS